MANTYTDTVFSKLYINVLSKAKYDSLLADNAISDSELYMVPEESFQYVDTETLKDLYQATLVSGTNIKTINGQSLLGSGDLTISGGSDVDLSNYYTKSEINTSLSKKQNTLVSGTNIKTINGKSLLGSGNIQINIHEVDLSGYYTKTEVDNKIPDISNLASTEYVENKLRNVSSVTFRDWGK